ncbi:MAG: PP2C family serine/threonine-protein phosphatase [bacterium]
MKQPATSFNIESRAITDRGLNERRPLNEDSFLADSERVIFAVADGVGGAEAGEVASQTAIEVLDEAFRHQVDGADIEDLMELAIQRANASIHQMAQDHAKFSMMATTIVALHLKGNIATIGHVGDSRLYRLTPEGELLRETEDHSVVEEEVRAGRMTAEQAANHPSKNVISRALGAEDTVEVDLKTMEVAEGTEFLLCTDGITRHISDAELRQLLITQNDLADLCEELKRRCYDRGAEDNLTAVIIRVGVHISPDNRPEDLQRTISPEASQETAASLPAQPAYAGNLDETQDALRLLPSDFPASAARSQGEQIVTAERKLNITDRNSPTGNVGSSVGRFLIFLVVLAALGATFYGGRRYRGSIPYLDEKVGMAQPTPISAPPEDPLLKFERARRDVDRDPKAWLGTEMTRLLAAQGVLNPIESSDPEFLYLYGRASLLSGNSDEAARAFEQAITKSDAQTSPANATLRKEATLALAALALKSDSVKPQALTHYDEMLPKPSSSSSP